MGNDDHKVCANCKHEDYYHNGNGNLFNTKGCGVSYCKCKRFVDEG